MYQNYIIEWMRIRWWHTGSFDALDAEACSMESQNVNEYLAETKNFKVEEVIM